MREPDGFRDYVAAHQGSLRYRALLLTGDPATAEDLVQVTLMRVWPHWGRVSTAGSIDAYIARTMTRCYLSWRRRKWHGERPTENLPEHPGADDDYAAADRRDEIGRVLPTLPPRQRATIVLRYYDDLTEAQTADALGCTAGTVKSQTSRALATLRTALTDDGTAERQETP